MAGSRPGRVRRRGGADSMVLTALFLAAAYWGLEAFLNVFSPGEISVYRELLGPRVGEMGMRIIAACLFLLFGSHVQYTINERRRAEEALRASEEKYRTILESIEEGYYEVDLFGRLRFANDSLRRLLGRPQAALLGLPLEEALGEEAAAALGEAFERCRREKRPVKAVECRLQAGGETRIVEASVSPLRGRDGEIAGFRGILRDRTETRRLEMDLLESYRKLQQARAATILGLAKLAEYRDEGTGTHLERIREYARVLAEELSRLPRYRGYIDARYIEDIYQSAILHDIGKVGIPDTILLKPGELTGEEFEAIRRHTVLGAEAIAAIQEGIEGRSFLNIGREIAFCHHERWDGSGYPRGLRGEAIPLSARIVAVADVYDALTTRRFYKDAFSHEKARRIILSLRGKHFDPDVVDAFLRVEGRFDRIRRERLAEEESARGLPPPGDRRVSAG